MARHQINPNMMRKPNVGGIKTDALDQHQRDLAALAKALQMERKMARVCVTVKLERGMLTARPGTIRHILTERGYSQSEIDNILMTAK